LEENEQSAQASLDFLKKLWCCEIPYEVSVSITYSPSADDLMYTIKIVDKETHYQRQKSEQDIKSFYNSLKNVFKKITLPELVFEARAIRPTGSADDSSFTKNIEEFFKLVLNDADFFCSEIWKFFGCKQMETFKHIYQLNQCHLKENTGLLSVQKILNFEIKAKVNRYDFEVDKHNDLRIVILYWIMYRLSS
jgi:hypothetical protein